MIGGSQNRPSTILNLVSIFALSLSSVLVYSDEGKVLEFPASNLMKATTDGWLENLCGILFIIQMRFNMRHLYFISHVCSGYLMGQHYLERNIKGETSCILQIDRYVFCSYSSETDILPLSIMSVVERKTDMYLLMSR